MSKTSSRKTAASANKGRPLGTRNLPSGPTEPMPTRIEPMTVQIAEGPFESPQWAYEPKLDGFRVAAAFGERL